MDGFNIKIHFLRYSSYFVNWLLFAAIVLITVVLGALSLNFNFQKNRSHTIELKVILLDMDILILNTLII